MGKTTKDVLKIIDQKFEENWISKEPKLNIADACSVQRRFVPVTRVLEF